MSPRREAVGIVIVSHSEKLAAGVCEVAAQMAPDIAIRPAGGTNEGAIGTSFEKILAAATEADGGGGVVILYDLGSAKMSADLVAEMVDGVRVVDAPLVEGAIAAAVTAQGGAGIDAVAGDAAAAGGRVAPRDEATPPARGPTHARVFTLQNPHGLHARPAARVARIAAEHAVTLRLGANAGGLLDARSVLAVVALGLRGGSEVHVEAEGERAGAALAAIEAAIADGFGENAQDDARPAGTGAVPGIAIGPVRRIQTAEPTVAERTGDPVAERAALDEALARVDRELAAEPSDIAGAHRALLADPELADGARALIAAGSAAAPAWWRAVRGARARLAASADSLIAHRAMDVTDVGIRVLSQLDPERAGAQRRDLSAMASAIAVADDLTPSMVGQLADAGVAGIVLSRGGVTAHSVVVARGRAVPMLVQAGDLDGIAEGTLAILDGDRGTWIVGPDPRALAEARARQATAAAANAAATAAAHRAVTWRDGRTITVAANVASAAEARLARKNGADAIGLFRTELFYVDKLQLPTEDEQVGQIERVLEAFVEREVTIRTLDAGGDKNIPALGLDPITHGFLGLRGLRYSLAHPETFRIQLRAILRAAAHWKGTLSVMAPMVTNVDEIVAFRSAIDDAVRSLRGQPHRLPDHIGIMVEVPAAAIGFDAMAAHVDFVSVGTNDLVQYMMAAERTNAAVANLYRPNHPALWRTLELLARAAAGKKIAVCGEMAAHPDDARRLVELGVTELSMASSSIPAVKAALATERR